MSLSQADLVWIARLPAPDELSAGEVRTLRALRRQAGGSDDQRLLDSLLIHADEILEEDARPQVAAMRLALLEDLLHGPAARRSPAQRRVGAERIAVHVANAAYDKELHRIHGDLSLTVTDRKRQLEEARRARAESMSQTTHRLRTDWDRRAKERYREMRHERDRLRSEVAS
jgi:hypothetical protein